MDETIDFQSLIKYAFLAIQTIDHFFIFNQNLKEFEGDVALLHLDNVIEGNYLDSTYFNI